MFAQNAAMHQHRFAALLLCANWFHQAAAVSSTVAGVDVYMLAPQAARAVVGVAIANDFLVAIFAGKVFDSSLKFPHVPRL